MVLIVSLKHWQMIMYSLTCVILFRCTMGMTTLARELLVEHMSYVMQYDPHSRFPFIVL